MAAFFDLKVRRSKPRLKLIPAEITEAELSPQFMFDPNGQSQLDPQSRDSADLSLERKGR